MHSRSLRDRYSLVWDFVSLYAIELALQLQYICERDTPDKVENDMAHYACLVPMSSYTKEIHNIGRRPAVDAKMDLPREVLWTCKFTIARTRGENIRPDGR